MLDLADRLAELSRQLSASGAAIDGTFDDTFRELSGECTACIEAGAPHGLRDRNGQIYWDLTWGLVDVVIIRIGGIGTLAYPGGEPG